MNTTYTQLLGQLESLGFTSLEGKIYMALLADGKMSAYQLAKKIDISRPSIYNAIEHMVGKGMIDYVPEKTPLYVAKEPSLLFSKLKQSMEHSIDSAGKLIDEYTKAHTPEVILALEGYDDIILKAKELLKNATHDIYMNADFDLDIFQEEFKLLASRGISIYVFSFYQIHTGSEQVKLYTHNRPLDPSHLPSRFMMAEFETTSLVAGVSNRFDDWKGVVNNTPLNVSIICEHIHNDIYMLNWRNIYGKVLYEQNKIGSQFEENNTLKNRGTL